MTLIDTAIKRLQNAVNALMGKTDDLERRVRALESKERPGVFNNVFVGTSALVNGLSRLTISGANASSLGPHMEFFTGADAYPLMQILPWTHDNISLLFDAYFDGSAWKSSDAGSNFRLAKFNDVFVITYDSGIAQGSGVTWATALSVSNAGVVSLATPLGPASGGTGINNGTNALTVPATGTAALRGANGGNTRVAFFTDANTVDGDAGMTYNSSTDALSVGGTITAGDIISVAEDDAGTTDQVALLSLNRTSSGTPGVGFGTNLRWLLESTTTANRAAGTIQVVWATATDASRKSRMVLIVNDNASSREVLRGEASGSAAMIGFLGAAAVARQTVTGSRGGNAALASLLTALANEGLITDSSSA